MITAQIYSWILLAVAFASKNKPSDLKEISMIADGINHVVPTDKELQISIKWLIKEGLIFRQGNTYSLTNDGNKMVDEASSDTKIIRAIWEKLELLIDKHVQN